MFSSLDPRQLSVVRAMRVSFPSSLRVHKELRQRIAQPARVAPFLRTTRSEGVFTTRNDSLALKRRPNPSRLIWASGPRGSGARNEGQTEMRMLAVALLIVGAIALIYGGFSYNRQQTILDVGSIHATETEHKTVPISPIAGGIAVACGVALLVVPRRRSA
jgi:hypothetical protein